MAMLFGGDADYLLGNVGVLPPFTYNNFVVSLWVKPDVGDDATTDTILSLSASGVADWFRINFYQGQISPPINPSLQAVWFDGADTITLIHTPPDPYEWMHIAVRVASDPEDSTQQVYRALYVDNVLEDDDATVWDGTFDTDLGRLHIACRPSGLTRTGYFPGTICELGWWIYTTDITEFDWVTKMSRYSPLAINSYSVDYYWPLQSAECYGLVDRIKHVTFTNTGGTWTQDHPAVAWPYSIGG